MTKLYYTRDKANWPYQYTLWFERPVLDRYMFKGNNILRMDSKPLEGLEKLKLGQMKIFVLKEIK